jgi:hypothetical protein
MVSACVSFLLSFDVCFDTFPFLFFDLLLFSFLWNKFFQQFMLFCSTTFFSEAPQTVKKKTFLDWPILQDTTGTDEKSPASRTSTLDWFT